MTSVSKFIAFYLCCSLFIAATIPLSAASFDASTWPNISKEDFTAAPTPNKRAWMQRMHANSKLEAPSNIKALQILVWGLEDADAEVRKSAARECVKFLTSLRQACRGQRLGKLPMKREVIAEFGRAIAAKFEDPDLLVRSDAIISHIWLRGSADECDKAALKLMDELSLDVTEEWGRRKAILDLMMYTGYTKSALPLAYLHPNSRKKGEPVVGTKVEPWKQKPNDNTWFDFLENSIP